MVVRTVFVLLRLDAIVSGQARAVTQETPAEREIQTGDAHVYTASERVATRPNITDRPARRHFTAEGARAAVRLHAMPPTAIACTNVMISPRVGERRQDKQVRQRNIIAGSYQPGRIRSDQCAYWGFPFAQSKQT